MDEEILSILGIDSVEDLTQEEYLSLLMEASVRAQMKGSAISKDALIRITEEIKRVRSESKTAIAKGTSREEVRKRKVDPQKVFAAKPRPVQKPVGQKLLTASKEKEAEDQKETRALTRVIPSALNTLTAGVNNIVQVMVKDLTMEKKQSEAERKAAENLGREEREEDSEKKVADKSKNFFKGFKPPQLGIFDKLKNFFTMVALGGLFTWLSKPENQDKVTKFTDFIKDHGGKILMGIAGLLALGIGAQILSFVGALISVGGVLLGILMNPIFLKGLLIAAGIIAGTKAIADAGKKVELKFQDLIGGKGTTEAGNEFSFADIQDLREERKTFMTQSGMSPDVIEQQTKPFNDLMDAMKEQKRINDDLYNKKQAQESGDIRFDKVIPELEKKKEEQQKKVTELFKKLGITDQDLKQLQMREGRVEKDDTHFEKPGTGLSGGLSNLLGNTLSLFEGKPDPDSKSKPTYDELQKRRSEVGEDKMTREERKALYDYKFEMLGDIKPDYQKFLEEHKYQPSLAVLEAFINQQRLGYRRTKNGIGEYFRSEETPKPKPKPKPAGPDAPVLPEGADAANKQLLEKIRQGGADTKTKAILEDLIKNGSTQTPVKVSVTPAVIPPGPGQGASAHAGQNSVPRFPTTDQSNMAVAAVAGVYNSPIPRA